MTDRNNAPAGRLVPTGEKTTETGRPMLLSSKWMIEAGLAMCDELITTCEQLVARLDETDHEDVYLAMDVKSKTEWLQRVLQIAEEQEE
mgnify:CR=1 FL=1